MTFREYYLLSEEQKEALSKMDILQSALDIAGIEPTVGTLADGANVLVSGLRAALAKEPDQRKKHLINMGISAASMIPFADVLKLLKTRKLRRATVGGAVNQGSSPLAAAA